MIAATVRSATPGSAVAQVADRALGRGAVGLLWASFHPLRTKQRGRFTRSGHDFTLFTHHSGVHGHDDLPRTPTPRARSRSAGPSATARRRLAELAATPLVPADYLDVFNPLRRGAELRGRVVSVDARDRGRRDPRDPPGADWAGHVPGQYVRIGIDVDGVRLWRAYSLTHGPRADGYISITVKAVPDGKVSNHLVRDTHPGTLVHLEQAAGEFVLPPDGGKFLFVTAGSGITPVIGMLRNLFPVADSGAVRLPRSAASTSPSCTSRRASRTRSSSTTSASSTRPG